MTVMSISHIITNPVNTPTEIQPYGIGSDHHRIHKTYRFFAFLSVTTFKKGSQITNNCEFYALLLIFQNKIYSRKQN